MKQCFKPFQYFQKLQIFGVVLLLLPICLLTLSLLYGCKKNTIELPPYQSTTSTTWGPPPCDTCLPAITNEGKNTFGCKINGKNWLPKGGHLKPSVIVDLWGNRIQVIANNASTKDGMSMFCDPILDTCYISFPSQSSMESGGTYISDDLVQYYSTQPIISGYIHFTKVDYIRGIFSGTFAFDLYNNEEDTMHITEGRFDVRK